jgi:hypothetical protein
MVGTANHLILLTACECQRYAVTLVIASAKEAMVSGRAKRLVTPFSCELQSRNNLSKRRMRKVG